MDRQIVGPFSNPPYMSLLAQCVCLPPHHQPPSPTSCTHDNGRKEDASRGSNASCQHYHYSRQLCRPHSSDNEGPSSHHYLQYPQGTKLFIFLRSLHQPNSRFYWCNESLTMLANCCLVCYLLFHNRTWYVTLPELAVMKTYVLPSLSQASPLATIVFGLIAPTMRARR